MTTRGTQGQEVGQRRLVLDEHWLAWPGMHGGYVMAVSARAAAGLATLPLRALDTRFLRALNPGSVSVEAVRQHMSRSTVTVFAQLVQDGQTAAVSTCTFAAPRGAGATSYEASPAPVVPAPAARELYRDAELLFPFARKVEIRPATDTLPLAGADDAALTAWLRLHDVGRSLESVLILADAMPPALYARLRAPVPAPSMAITVHVTEPFASDEPFTGWLLAQQRNVRTSGGISIDECDLWGEDGRLIAQTRQLRRVIE